MEPKYDESQTKQYTTVNKQTKKQQIQLNGFNTAKQNRTQTQQTDLPNKMHSND